MYPILLQLPCLFFFLKTSGRLENGCIFFSFFFLRRLRRRFIFSSNLLLVEFLQKQF